MIALDISGAPAVAGDTESPSSAKATTDPVSVLLSSDGDKTLCGCYGTMASTPTHESTLGSTHDSTLEDTTSPVKTPVELTTRHSCHVTVETTRTLRSRNGSIPSGIKLFTTHGVMSNMEKNAEAFDSDVKPKTYKRRMWMLFLFFALAFLMGIMYPEYSSMANVTCCFYGVSQEDVAWTNSMPNGLFVLLVFPTTSLIEKIGMRWSLIIGAALNTAASAVQFATLSPDSFAWVLVSCLLSSLAAVTVLGTPPVIAAAWFPHSELSRACAVAVAGYQTGMSVGSLFPSVVSSDCDHKQLIRDGKFSVAIYLTAVNFILLLLVVVTFQNEPPTPPRKMEKNVEIVEYSTKDVLKFIKNKDYLFVLLLSGFFVGVFCAVLTTLNNLVLRYFPGSEVEIGWMGFLFSMTATFGGFVLGYILDCTHKYKQVTIGLCVVSIASYVAFSFLLYVNEMWVQFITIAILGFFVGGYVPLGFEYGIEVTYPDSAILCGNLNTASGLLFAVILTQLGTKVLDVYGPVYANVVQLVPLILACLVAVLITSNYRRSTKNTDELPNSAAPTN